MCPPFKDDEPASFYETFSSHNANEWMVSMKDEIISMEKNQFLKLVGLSFGHKFRNRWILKFKLKTDGSTDIALVL